MVTMISVVLLGWLLILSAIFHVVHANNANERNRSYSPCAKSHTASVTTAISSKEWPHLRRCGVSQGTFALARPPFVLSITLRFHSRHAAPLKAERDPRSDKVSDCFHQLVETDRLPQDCFHAVEIDGRNR